MKKFLSKKGTIWALSMCLMGGLAFAGYYSVNQLEQKREEQQNRIIDLNQEADGKTEQQKTEKAVDVADRKVDYEVAEKKESEETTEEMTQDSVKESEEAKDAASSQVEAKISPTVDFQETDVLTWPAAGEILLDYSMNGTIYFPTLNQYKYNSALVIGQEVNAPVMASARGIVKSIAIDEETGTTVTMDLGNNYELIYGQLKELAIQEGDLVEQGELIGYISEPTKYYCVEGSNLYFQMKKDGQPIDPVLYLEGE